MDDSTVSAEIIAAVIALVLGVFKLLEWIVKQMFEKDKSYLTDNQNKMLNEVHTVITRDDGRGGSMVLSTSQQNQQLLIENKEQSKDIKNGLEGVVKTQEKMIVTLEGFLNQQKEQTTILTALKTDVNIMSGVISNLKIFKQ